MASIDGVDHALPQFRRNAVRIIDKNDGESCADKHAPVGIVGAPHHGISARLRLGRCAAEGSVPRLAGFAVLRIQYDVKNLRGALAVACADRAAEAPAHTSVDSRTMR